jgi:HPt (histidine-containing phosphotransfer) domain-containing protein
MKQLVWDPSYLEEFIGEDQDATFISKYLETFDRRCEEAFELLHRAVHNNNAAAVADAAHMLKGAAVGVGGTCAGELAELIGGNPGSQLVPEYVELLGQKIAQLKVALKEHFLSGDKINLSS